MSRNSLLWAISLAVLGMTAWTSQGVAQATRFHDIQFLVTHADLDTLPGDFLLYATHSGHSDTAGPISLRRLVAPDGTVFSDRSRSIRRNNLSQIAATLLGNWTAFETLGGIESSYRFNVSPTALDDLPLGLPVITSPANGATVGESFEVHWTVDDVGPPKTTGFQYLLSPNLEIVNFEGVPGSSDAIRIETNLLARGPQKFEELMIILSRNLPKPSLIDSTPDLVGDDFKFSAHFQAISNPVTFNVVPEPSGLTTVLILAFVPNFTRRFRRASLRQACLSTRAAS